MSEFLKNLTFWKAVGLIIIISAAGWAISRIILAAMGKSPESLYVDNWMGNARQTSPVTTNTQTKTT